MSFSSEAETRPSHSIATDVYPETGFDLRSDYRDAAKRMSSSFYRGRGKRLFDICVSLLMLVLLAPLMLVLTAIISLGGGRPVFAHRRVGRKGRMFGCLKFRSMRTDAEKILPEILAADPEAAAEWERDHKLTNDPRVTRIGAFLRRSSLDELPQLLCVLRGEMSIVGPRPVTEPELFRYGPARSAYLSLRPGLTGPWQVQGRNDISYDNRVALDVNYARRVTLMLDLKIMFMTAFSMLRLTGR